MRVIGGEFRSRKLLTLPDLEVRPTPDRLRETLFNILSPVIRGSVFVDAYAGCGSVGIEAISRGAARAVFLEKSPEAIEAIKANIESLRIRSRCTVWRGFAHKKLKDLGGDIVFLDPPYPLEAEYGLAMGVLGKEPPRIWTIAQHSKRFEIEERYGDLERVRQVRQGENVLSFYRVTGMRETEESETLAEEAPLEGSALLSAKIEWALAQFER
jgi:16S rRNA (guanine(966)-N(2))-methyltransferase RsmD